MDLTRVGSSNLDFVFVILFPREINLGLSLGHDCFVRNKSIRKEISIKASMIRNEEFELLIHPTMHKKEKKEKKKRKKKKKKKNIEGRKQVNNVVLLRRRYACVLCR